MKKYCVIGARGGSKGIIDKNIQLINGKSLLKLATEKAIKTNIFDEIFISSDKASYASEIPDNEKVKFVLRPEEISGDTALEQEYLKHVIEINNLNTEGIISRMQCTSPFQSISSIVSAVTLLYENIHSFDSVQLVTTSSPSIYKALKIDKNGFLYPALQEGSLGPSNRQGFPKTYFRSNFYVTRIKNVISGNLLGDCSYPFQCDEKEKIDIDNKFDLELSRIIAENNPSWLD